MVDSIMSLGHVTQPEGWPKAPISGAVLFALFQIPDMLTSFFARLEPQTTSTVMAVMFFVQMYVKAIVYALIASFVVPLISRAYWVGLVGLHSSDSLLAISCAR